MSAQPKPAIANRDYENDPSSSNSADSKTASYLAHVILNGDTMVVDGRKQRLEPGMEVTAEIKTGRRAIVDYILSPLKTSFLGAAHEK